MHRTRKHKYKRKICNKRRTVSRNKKKTKTKPRSRRGGTRKIFKKSYKRYVMKGMKRRIQRGGSKNDHYLKLMALLYDEPYHQWSKSYMAVSGISDHNKFLEVLSKRRLFGLEDGKQQLEDVICSDKPMYTTDMEFALKMVTERKIADIQKWIDFIDSIRRTISNEEQRKNSLDIDDYNMLRTKKELYCGKAMTEKEKWLKDAYARICSELTTFLIKNAGKFTSGTGHTVVSVKGSDQFKIARTAIPRYEAQSLILDRTPFEPTLQTYLDYRLSHDRQGSNDLTDRIGAIQRFNEKIISINSKLSSSHTNNGKYLYTLLTLEGLIPVYFKDGGLRDDSVNNSDCLISVRETPFKRGLFSSGKHHCRTCGRCMNEEDKRTYNVDPGNKNMLLNPVCIDCYELFSGTTTPEPGGAAGSAASLSSASASAAP